MKNTKKKDFVLQLGWCVREADHMKACEADSLIKRLTRWTDPSLTLDCWFDLTYLPSWDSTDLEVARIPQGSSSKRQDAVQVWQRRGINRIRDDILGQAFWTACAVPIAAHLKPKARGRKTESWKREMGSPVPDALWREIFELWHLRYPKRLLPSATALRHRVLKAAPFLFKT